MSRILLIEDSLETQLLIIRVVGDSAIVTCVANGREGLTQAEASTFDLILLDVNLPDLNGFQLCAQLRGNDRTKQIPIIFITGNESTADKITGFSLGADDYIVKPFNPLELRARLQSKLKKCEEQQGTQKQWLQRGNIRLNVALQRGVVAGAQHEIDLALTPNEFKLLYYFFRHENHVLSRDQLLSELWSERGIHVTDRTIDKNISLLRKKLGPATHQIETVHGLGYRFCVAAATRKTA
jgi:DNA-binding response OmpR family regulator